VNKNNAVHAIVFEAVAVAIALEEPELMAMGVALLAKFLSVRPAACCWPACRPAACLVPAMRLLW